MSDEKYEARIAGFGKCLTRSKWRRIRPVSFNFRSIMNPKSFGAAKCRDAEQPLAGVTFDPRTRVVRC